MYRPMTQQEQEAWDEREEMLSHGVKSPGVAFRGSSLSYKELVEMAAFEQWLIKLGDAIRRMW